MDLFDTYIVVDWSAKSKPTPEKPSPNAVWVGERIVDRARGISTSSEHYFRTRQHCISDIRQRLVEHVRSRRRIFLGFDFAYGYPAGFAAACGLVGAVPPWRLVWDELKRLVEDHDDNSNNRFEVAGRLNRRCGGGSPGPFWGRPRGNVIPGLNATSPSYPYQVRPGIFLERKRSTELLLPGAQPTWKLYGAGSVGGQSLLGIPAVAALRHDPELRDVSRVWPFETGFALPDLFPGRSVILHVEIWPGVVKDRVDKLASVPDQAQVRAMVEWLAELDAAGELPPLFTRPTGLSDDTVRAVVDHEGWILGAGKPLRAD